MAAKWILQSLERFPGVEFIQAYGLTETSPLLTMLEMAEHEKALQLLVSHNSQRGPHRALFDAYSGLSAGGDFAALTTRARRFIEEVLRGRET